MRSRSAAASCSRVQAKTSGKYTITVEGKKETVKYSNKISDNIAMAYSVVSRKTRISDTINANQQETVKDNA